MKEEIKENPEFIATLLSASAHIAAVVFAIYATGYLLALGYFSEISLSLMSYFTSFELVVIGYSSNSVLITILISLGLVIVIIDLYLSTIIKRIERKLSREKSLFYEKIMCWILAISAALFGTLCIESDIFKVSLYYYIMISICVLLVESCFVLIIAGKRRKLKVILKRHRWFLCISLLLIGIPAIGSLGALVNVQSGLGVSVVRNGVTRQVTLLAVGANAVVYRDDHSVVIDNPKNVGPMIASIAKSDFSKNLK